MTWWAEACHHSTDCHACRHYNDQSLVKGMLPSGLYFFLIEEDLGYILLQANNVCSRQLVRCWAGNLKKNQFKISAVFLWPWLSFQLLWNKDFASKFEKTKIDNNCFRKTRRANQNVIDLLKIGRNVRVISNSKTNLKRCRVLQSRDARAEVGKGGSSYGRQWKIIKKQKIVTNYACFCLATMLT